MRNKVKENDLYIYFELIEQLEPESVLDAGLFLKRAGCVCRKAMNREIPEQIRLDGIDLCRDTNFLATQNIYHNILDVRTFLTRTSTQHYDCSILTGIEHLHLHPFASSLFQKIQTCSRYALTSCCFEAWPRAQYKVIDLNVENDRYYLFDFGE